MRYFQLIILQTKIIGLLTMIFFYPTGCNILKLCLILDLLLVTWINLMIEIPFDSAVGEAPLKALTQIVGRVTNKEIPS